MKITPSFAILGALCSAATATLSPAAELKDGKELLEAAQRNQQTIAYYRTTEKLADLQPGVEVLRTVTVHNIAGASPVERWEVGTYVAGRLQAAPQVQIHNADGVWNVYSRVVIRMPPSLNEAPGEVVASAADFERRAGDPEYKWSVTAESVGGRPFYRVVAVLSAPQVAILREVVRGRFNEHRADLASAKVKPDAIDDFVPARYEYSIDATANFVVEVKVVSASGKEMRGRRYLSVDVRPDVTPEALVLPPREEILLPKNEAEYVALRRTYVLSDSKAANASKNNPKTKDKQ